MDMNQTLHYSCNSGNLSEIVNDKFNLVGELD